MAKEMRSKAYQAYASHRSSSWILAFLLTLIFAVGVLVSLYSTILGIILIPLFILPSAYAIVLMHLSLQFGGTITLASFFKYFKMYFKKNNSGVFDVITNIFKTVLIYIIFSVVFSLVAYVVCYMIDGENLNLAFAKLTEFYTLSAETDISSVLTETQLKLLSLYEYINIIPTVIFTNVYFLYRFFINFLSCYFRLSFPNAQPAFAKAVYAHTLNKNKKTLYKDYFKLNWPLFLLFIGGCVIGVTISFFSLETITELFINDIPTQICYIASLFGFILMTMYVPFLFNNMEVLFEKYEDEFAKSSNDVTENYLRKIQSNIELNIEEQQKIEKMLSDLKNPLEDENHKENEDDIVQDEIKKEEDENNKDESEL